MQTYQGIIKTWKPDRGFGFIQSAASERDIFIHISDFKHAGYEPKMGDSVDFKLMLDKAGKIRAYDATISGQEIVHKPAKRPVYAKNADRPKKKLGVLFIMIALIPFVFSMLLIKEQRIVAPLFIYLIMSLVTFLAYAVDKTKAHKNQWRTQESILHFLELIGGWPGALISQQVIRHKNKKLSFQVVFWPIVLLHLAVWTDYLFLKVH
ncbi:MAG: cold shock and DUF1294 domain-containing protein [Methylococcaceae bacterium]|jgi:uncharacterized membrane protein YsdA (DUF1294 family)/cold shock CspA family protein